MGCYIGFIQWFILSEIVGGSISADLRRVYWFIGYSLLIGLLFIRLSRVFWSLAFLIMALFAVISFTPLSRYLLRSCLREDPLQKAPAIVVLNAGLPMNYAVGKDMQSRLLQAYRLLARGYSDHLVMTQMPPKSWSNVPYALEQMKDLKIQPKMDIVGPAYSTRDEAVECARLARSRGWKAVILVTQPSHMGRAAATFEKAGLKVIASPSVEWDYVPDDPKTPAQNRAAFKDWLYEKLRVLLYRSKGWM